MRIDIPNWEVVPFYFLSPPGGAAALGGGWRQHAVDLELQEKRNTFGALTEPRGAKGPPSRKNGKAPGPQKQNQYNYFVVKQFLHCITLRFVFQQSLKYI